MKRTQRQHLKENELAHLATAAREALEARRSQTLGAVIAVGVVAVLVFGYMAWQSRTQSRAGGLLAEALAVDDAQVGPPPAPGTPAQGLTFPTEREKKEAVLAKLKAVADQYPSTDPGLFARYRMGATLMALDRPAEAVTAYQDVVDRAGNSVYGQMARLGLAEAHARNGEYDRAIDTYTQLSQQTDGPLPIDGVLMQLARTYRDAGKAAEAEQTFNKLVEQFPNSPFSSEARRELDAMKKRT